MSWLAVAQFSQQYFVIPLFMFAFLVFVYLKYFRKNYVIPARALESDLNDVISKIQALDQSSNKNEYKEKLNSIFKNSNLDHSWLMYQTTLHDEQQIIDGEDQLLRSRATVTSDTFFSQSIIVDRHLEVDFFKHLPGIITGVGIIATFLGLLSGLLAFDPAGDPDKVQDSLGLLLGGVSEAFIASAMAIATAMIITAKEKSWLRKCYAKLEDLTTEIDRLFESDDVGEEYLAKLLKSAQARETNAKQLKDSLVGDLKAMITNMVDENKKNQLVLATQLTEGYNKASQEMATQIGQSISDTLQAPLDKIAAGVQQVSGDQGAAVQGLLSDVLSAFMGRLESTFGGQMSGMSEMMTQSVAAMREMQLGFNQLIADMQSNSQGSTERVESHMSQMLEQIQLKQNEMTEGMNRLLDNFSQGAAKMGEQGQQAVALMNEQVGGLLQQMSDQVNHLMSDLTQQRAQQDQVIADNQQKMNDQTTQSIEKLNTEVSKLINQCQLLIQSSTANIKKLDQLVSSSISGVNQSAEKMRNAAEQFNTAGEKMVAVSHKTTNLIAEVNTTSGNLMSASSQLNTLFTEYKKSQKSVELAIHALEGVIQQAKSEAGMSSAMLSDMKHMVTALNQVKQEMQLYLNQVSDVLVKGFDSFGASVESSLNQSLGAFDNTLDQAVKRLASGVEGLTHVTEDLADLVQQKKY